MCLLFLQMWLVHGLVFLTDANCCSASGFDKICTKLREAGNYLFRRLFIAIVFLMPFYNNLKSKIRCQKKKILLTKFW